jgi:hypothetical protein
MIISYNEVLRRFEAQFTTDFNGDLAAVKAAGFKTDGPASGWIWHTAKIPVLNKLREHRPASGLEIMNDALAVYKVLAERESKNAEAKEKFKEIEKKAKKERKEKEQEEQTTTLFAVPEGKIWLGPEDLPPKPPFVSEMAPIPEHKGPWCHICGQPVYFYEIQDPPTCLWCETHPAKISA